MKKIIRITESKLSEIVSKIISEQNSGYVPDYRYNQKSTPKPRVQLPKEKWEKQPWDGQDQEGIAPLDYQKTQLVKHIQQKLGVKPDGIYGPMTARAVRNLQSKNNIRPTGVISAGDPTSKLFFGAPWGSVKMLTNLGTTPMLDPIKKPVSPIAPPRDTTPISSIPSRPTGKVGVQQPKKDTISQDYRQRQGNYNV